MTGRNGVDLYQLSWQLICTDVVDAVRVVERGVRRVMRERERERERERRLRRRPRLPRQPRKKISLLDC